MTEDACPRCGTALVGVDDAPPWCPSCEWNLNAWEPAVCPSRGWPVLDRNAHLIANRIDRQLHAQLAAAAPTAPLRGPGGTAMVVVAALVMLVDIAALLVGIWLVVDPSFAWAVPVGLVLVAIGAAARPRFGRRPPRRRRRSHDESPTLFGLILETARALQGPPPDDVALDLGDAVSFDRVGLRRRGVLTIGGRLWAQLGPAERLAALAYALALDGTGDPYRSAIVAPVRAAVAAVCAATRPERSLHSLVVDARRHRIRLLAALGWVVSRPFGRCAVALGYALDSLGRRDHQRALLLADARVADVAGTDAVIALTDRLLLAEPVGRLLYHAATHQRPAQWAATVDDYVGARRGDLDLLRQYDARRSSLWIDRGPPGRRARLLFAWPCRPPRIVVSADDSARIDADLAAWIAAVHREMLGSRDFRARTPGRAG